ncbi:MAG: type III secretion system export apparatus subunit SctR [Burkholderiaceae bacterium]
MGNLPDPITLIPFLFALAFVPIAAVMVTAYTKLVVVFALLRNALGLQQVPPPMVTNGLALVLTFFIMYPVIQQVLQAMDPVTGLPPAGMSLLDLLQIAKEPLREFLGTHASAREVAFFSESAQRIARPELASSISAKDFVVLIPAFTISELTEAFLIGFLLFLPFVVIDLIVANVLLALGMMMMPPPVVALPFKILLFVMLDGWSRLAHSLTMSYF